jgi:hypothetical protein
MEYKDQIKSPKWQKKRLEILKRDEFTCQQCGNKELTLHVHHKHYNNDAMIWEYENWELITLCEDCHSNVHDKKQDKVELKKYQLSILDGIGEFDDYEIFYLDSLIHRYGALKGDIKDFTILAKLDSFMINPATYNRLIKILDVNLEYELILDRIDCIEKKLGL